MATEAVLATLNHIWGVLQPLGHPLALMGGIPLAGPRPVKLRSKSGENGKQANDAHIALPQSCAKSMRLIRRHRLLDPLWPLHLCVS